MPARNFGDPEGFHAQVGYTVVQWPHLGVSLWLGWFDLFTCQVALGWWWFHVRLSRAQWRPGKGPVQ